MIASLALLLGLSLPASSLDTPVEARIIRVSRIWDRDPHSAFTDMVYWQKRFVCVFRTGKKHVSPDGAIQVLSSEDGSRWQPIARITSTDDLRDPKLVIGLKGELLLYAAAARQNPKQHQTLVWSSSDGIQWSKPIAIGEIDSWLWRVTRHQTGFLGWGYGTRDRFIRLYRSATGTDFQPITPRIMADQGYANETAMHLEGEQGWCLLRRDGEGSQAHGLWGTAKAPFTDWTWHDLGIKLGGPALLRLPGGQFLATVRLYSPKVRTSLCLVNVGKTQLQELVTLPSSGDSSYAGMVWHQSRLWISYYSSHEGKTAIYLAEVEIRQE